jgi:hypothetical protein
MSNDKGKISLKTVAVPDSTEIYFEAEPQRVRNMYIAGQTEAAMIRILESITEDELAGLSPLNRIKALEGLARVRGGLVISESVKERDVDNALNGLRKVGIGTTLGKREDSEE